MKKVRDAKPLFLIGPPRSGSTILAKTLNTHPNLLMTDETAVFLALAALIEKSHKGVKEGLWYGKTYNHLWADLLQEKSRELIWEFYDRIAAHEGKKALQFWGDKHPHYCNCLDFIYELFPDSRFIFLVRDPRDAAVSLAKLNNWSLEKAIEGLYVFFSRYQRFFSRFSKIPMYQLRYEELVSNYQAETARVFGWLGLPWAKETEQFIAERAGRDAHTEMGDDVPWRNFSQSVGRWREVLNPSQVRLAHQLLGEFMARFSYDLE